MIKQRHIYFFLPDFTLGGAGNSILNICKTLKNKKNKINVISLGKNHYKKNFQKINVNITEISSKKTILGIIKIYFKLKKISKQTNIIFVSNINYANVLSSIIIKNIKNLKLVLIERTPLQELEIYSSFKDFIKKKIIFYLAKIFYRRADYIIGNSSKVSSYIRLKFNLNVLTINPIINIKKKYEKKYNEILQISWIGRHSSEKRLFDFIKSIDHIQNENVKFNIISNKNIKKEIKLSVSKKTYSKLEFYKFKNDKRFLDYIYNKTDILVNTSIYEGFPNTIVEAVSFNCLIITSKSFGGYSDIILNNNFGLLYKTGNINELSQKLKFAIRNFKNCKIKIKNAKKNLIKLSKKNDTYIKFFNKI